MKFSAALVAVATASPTAFIVENWWNEAVNVFGYASNNWGDFSSAVDNVSKSEFITSVKLFSG